MNKNPRLTKLLVGISFAFFLFFLGAYVAGKSSKPAPIGPFVVTDSVRPPVKVQVAGEVRNPGVYDLPGGSRIQDALQAAGGALPDADTNSLKLADWVTDGSKIDVPVQGSPAPVAAPPALAPTSAPVPGNAGSMSPAPTLPPAPTPGDPSGAAPANSAPSKSSDVYLDYLKKNPVDINHASAAQIEVLPDLGPKMAERIVEYRDTHGPFKSVNELDNVKGIGEKRIATLKDLVIIQ